MFSLISNSPWLSFFFILPIMAIFWIVFSWRKNFTNSVDYRINGKKGAFSYKPEWWLKNWRTVVKVLFVVAIALFLAVMCTDAKASGFYLPPPFSWMLAMLDWLLKCGGLCN